MHIEYVYVEELYVVSIEGADADLWQNKLENRGEKPISSAPLDAIWAWSILDWQKGFDFYYFLYTNNIGNGVCPMVVRLCLHTRLLYTMIQTNYWIVSVSLQHTLLNAPNRF